MTPKQLTSQERRTMNNLEEFVLLALNAYSSVHSVGTEQSKSFELYLRRTLMEKYCNGTKHTYTITAGQGVMGTWTTNKQQLNG